MLFPFSHLLQLLVECQFLYNYSSSARKYTSPPLPIHAPLTRGNKKVPLVIRAPLLKVWKPISQKFTKEISLCHHQLNIIHFPACMEQSNQLLYPSSITLQNEYFEAFIFSQVVMNLRAYFDNVKLKHHLIK